MRWSGHRTPATCVGAAIAPRRRATFRQTLLDLGGLLLFLLEATDEIGDVGHLLLQILLILLEVVQPLLTVGDAAPAETGPAPMAVPVATGHVHLPSPCS